MIDSTPQVADVERGEQLFRLCRVEQGKRLFRLAERDTSDVGDGIGAVCSCMRHLALPVSAAVEDGYAQQDTDDKSVFCLVHIGLNQCVCKIKGICSGQDIFYEKLPVPCLFCRTLVFNVYCAAYGR